MRDDRDHSQGYGRIVRRILKLLGRGAAPAASPTAITSQGPDEAHPRDVAEPDPHPQGAVAEEPGSTEPPSSVSSSPHPIRVLPRAKFVQILTPLVANELLRRPRSANFNLSTAEALQRVYLKLFGEGRPRQQYIGFLHYASPIARRIAMGQADANCPIGIPDIKVADLKLWLWWLDGMDPLTARMVDLHYVAGLSIRETAAALEWPPGAVIRDLRFAKSWLTVKLA